MDLFNAMAGRYSYRGDYTDDPVWRETPRKTANAALDLAGDGAGETGGIEGGYAPHPRSPLYQPLPEIGDG